MRKLRSIGAALAASGIIAGSVIAVGTGVASATPTLTISPSTVVGNQVVTVTGTGFAPKQVVNVCQHGPSGSCDSPFDGVSAMTSSAGVLRTKITVLAGNVGVNGDQCGTPDSGPTGCYIAAGGLQANLTFRLPALTITGIPAAGAVGNTIVRVSGTGFPAKDSIGVVQCSPAVLSSGSQDDCDVSQPGGAVSSAGGSFSTKLKLLEGSTYSDADGGQCLPSSLGGAGSCVIGAADITNQVMAASASFDWASPTLSVTPTSFPDTNGSSGPATALIEASGFPTGDHLIGIECEPGTPPTVCNIGNQLGGTSVGISGKVKWQPYQYMGEWPYREPGTGRLPILTDSTTPAFQYGSVTPTSGALILVADADQMAPLYLSQDITISP